MSSVRKWPEWWDWELEFNPHLMKRMVDRRFNEVDLRTILTDAHDYADEGNGRFVVNTLKEGRSWEVVVEPDWTDRVLLVVTAYPKE